ncbi:hypothetical protein PSSHI_14370 [Photobacterium sp. R1]
MPRISEIPTIINSECFAYRSNYKGDGNEESSQTALAEFIDPYLKNVTPDRLIPHEVIWYGAFISHLIHDDS